MTDSSKIKKIVKRAELGSSNISPIGAGHYNDSYYLDSVKGKFVLRIAPADNVPKLFYEIDMMKSEVNIHKLAKERTSIPIPEILHYDFSREIIDRDYLIMEHLEGSPGYFDDRELGKYIRELHDIEGQQFGYPERAAPVGESWPDIFPNYVELIFNDCLSCGVIDDKEYEYFISTYKKHQDVIEQVRPCLLHLDLWGQNILTVDGKITAILDFDRGLYGDSELEFAVLDTYGYSTAEFFEGYKKKRPADRKAMIRQNLYIVYELIKYAFIRVARGKNMPVGRRHVAQCKRILQEIK